MPWCELVDKIECSWCFLFCFLTSLITFVIVCREGERTLKLHFLSPKSFDLLSQTDLISLFLYLRFLCFFVSHNTKAYIFLVNLFACREGGRAHYNCIFYLKTPGVRVYFLCFFGLWLNFFIFVSFLKRVHSFLYPFFWGFLIFYKTKSLIFLGVFPLFCILCSRTTKSLNFFILFSDFS